MEEPLFACFLLPPDVEAAAAAATTSPPRYPAWVLLDKKGYFADRENATTATTTSWTGHTIKVTFCLADPPAVSHFCVHGPEIKPEHFVEEPRVVSSEKDLVLLSFVFTGGPRSTVLDSHRGEYFIYKAGRGKPSLTPIPASPPGTTDTLFMSIVSCYDGDEEEFILADLFVTSTLGYYDLTFFSSKIGTWTTRRLELRTSSAHIRAMDLFVVPHKVISLGRGVVGWVDLWRGVIGCNFLEKNPYIYFIPLPKPEFNMSRSGDPKPVRDVACYNGVITLVEIDHYFIREVVTINNNSNKRLKMMKDLDSLDIIYDKDLLLDLHENPLGDSREEIISVPNGWKIRTCYRHTSSYSWRKGYCINVDEFSANNPTYSTYLPELLDASVTKSTLRNLTTAYPTLNINGNDVVYLMSKVDRDDKNAWIVGVDLRKKTIEIAEPYFAERATYFNPDFLTCAFSEYLNTTQRSCGDESVISTMRNFVTHGHIFSDCPYHNGVVYGHDNKQ
ncbi:unnamed protein product [Alopecurus aequalis]